MAQLSGPVIERSRRTRAEASYLREESMRLRTRTDETKSRIAELRERHAATSERIGRWPCFAPPDASLFRVLVVHAGGG